MTVDWDRHGKAWRRPEQVVAHWADADAVDPSLLDARTRGGWWDLLAEHGITLLLTREYEHLVLALSGHSRRASFLPLPHPSGVAVDPGSGAVTVASTRNPNQLFRLEGVRPEPGDAGAMPVLAPVASRVLPGRLYLHDLAFVGGVLHANAVGENTVVRLADGAPPERVWWPASIDTADGPRTDRNYLQLNSIAAGATVERSFFTASTDTIGRRRPGHRDFAVDGRGVVLDGGTREPAVRGLTRPHSARLLRDELWVDNSGYGELGVVHQGRLEVAARLPGWTRGLCFDGDVAFVGTSRVIPAYRSYAPGLDVDTSVCGVHAVDTRSGAVLAGIVWPAGNQIFAIDAVPSASTTGLPFDARRRSRSREHDLFYSFRTA